MDFKFKLNDDLDLHVLLDKDDLHFTKSSNKISDGYLYYSPATNERMSFRKAEVSVFFKAIEKLQKIYSLK